MAPRTNVQVGNGITSEVLSQVRSLRLMVGWLIAIVVAMFVVVVPLLGYDTAVMARLNDVFDALSRL